MMIAIGSWPKPRYFDRTKPTKKNPPISLSQIIDVRMAKPTPVIMPDAADRPLITHAGRLPITLCKPSTPKATARNRMIVCGRRSTNKPHKMV